MATPPSPPSSGKSPSATAKPDLADTASSIKSEAASAFGRSVRSVKEEPSLSIHMDSMHAFIRLSNPQTNFERSQGLYPQDTESDDSSNNASAENVADAADTANGTMSDDGGDDQSAENVTDAADTTNAITSDNGSDNESDGNVTNATDTAGAITKKLDADDAAVMFLATKMLTGFYVPNSWFSRGDQGMIQDEEITYGGKDEVMEVPSVSFTLTRDEFQAIADFMVKSGRGCARPWPEGVEGDLCRYDLLGHNCVDYVQEAFSLLGRPGHFVDYLPEAVLANQSSLVPVFAAAQRPEYRVPAQWATTGMLLLTLKPVVSKTAAAIGKIGGWASSWFLSPRSQADAAPEAPAPETLEALFNAVRQQYHACERQWDVYLGQPAPDRKVIDKVTDLQFQFVELEKRVQKSGFAVADGADMAKKLRSLQEGFGQFIAQSAGKSDGSV